jgi:hypothetical protein
VGQHVDAAVPADRCGDQRVAGGWVAHLGYDTDRAGGRVTPRDVLGDGEDIALQVGHDEPHALRREGRTGPVQLGHRDRYNGQMSYAGDLGDRDEST